MITTDGIPILVEEGAPFGTPNRCVFLFTEDDNSSLDYAFTEDGARRLSYALDGSMPYKAVDGDGDELFIHSTMGGVVHLGRLELTKASAHHLAESLRELA